MTSRVCVLLVLSGVIGYGFPQTLTGHGKTEEDTNNVLPSVGKRSIWDVINNANISVENHVHSYSSAKSDISKNGTRRNLLDTLNNAGNISVVNHVQSVYTAKSDIAKEGNSTRPVKKSDVKQEVALDRRLHDDVDPIKRDDLPRGGIDDDPEPLSVRGKSPSDVADAIEDNDQVVIPMLEKQQFKTLKKAKDSSFTGPEYVASDEGHFPAEADPYYFGKFAKKLGARDKDVEPEEPGGPEEEAFRGGHHGRIIPDESQDPESDREDENEREMFREEGMGGRRARPRYRYRGHHNEEGEGDGEYEGKGGGKEYYSKEEQPDMEEEYAHARVHGHHPSHMSRQRHFNDEKEKENDDYDNDEDDRERLKETEGARMMGRRKRPVEAATSHLLPHHRRHGRYPVAEREENEKSSEDRSPEEKERFEENAHSPHSESHEPREEEEEEEENPHHHPHSRGQSEEDTPEKGEQQCRKKRNGICDEFRGEFLS